MSRFQIERSQVWKLLLGTVGCAAAITAYLGRADAQSNADDCGVLGKNCSFTISDNAVQKVPTLFKIQAQISQAKIPLGDAIFSKLVVNVKSGNTQLCTENFSQVRVRSGVLNLEVGRNIQGCQLDDVVA
jgi:nitrate reductase NapAB chaperone NapD